MRGPAGSPGSVPRAHHGGEDRFDHPVAVEALRQLGVGTPQVARPRRSLDGPGVGGQVVRRHRIASLGSAVAHEAGGEAVGEPAGLVAPEGIDIPALRADGVARRDGSLPCVHLFVTFG